MFSGLEFKLRGDGRTYIINLQTDGLQPDDVYQAFIYTKGGPDWETVRVYYHQ